MAEMDDTETATCRFLAAMAEQERSVEVRAGRALRAEYWRSFLGGGGGYKAF